MEADNNRWILHLDMDAFFASVEQLDNPEYRGKPLIIGGAQRGVVSTASYEARKFGVHSAMPIFQAKKLCPQGIYIKGRMKRYAEKSREVMAALERFSPTIEKASIDEAYLDISGLERIYGPVPDIGNMVQQAVFDETGLTCSVGIAPIKFLAKIASDMKKPAGLTFIPPEQVMPLLKDLPVGKIPGVGRQSFAALDLLNVKTCGDVLRFPRDFWVKRMGKYGGILHDRCSGIDPREVEPYSDPKSESAENTFPQNISSINELSKWLLKQSERVGSSLRANNLQGRTITLKLKYADFTQKTRSRTLKQPTNLTKVIYDTAVDLLKAQRLEKPLRLIGVGVSQFGLSERQFSLLDDPEHMDRERQASLDATLDTLRNRFGINAVVRGKLFDGE